MIIVIYFTILPATLLYGLSNTQSKIQSLNNLIEQELETKINY